MKLDHPITINPDSDNPIILDELDIFLIDHPSRKIVLAKLHPGLSPLPLWRGKEYDEIGDYTQSQVENRIKQLLVDIPNTVLEG